MVSKKLIAIALLCMVCFQVDAMKRAASESSAQRSNKRQKTGISRRSVHDMIDEGNFSAIQEYLSNGGNSNELNADGFSALLYLVNSDELDVDQKIKLLNMFKEHGANMNAIAPKTGGTALHYMSAAGNEPVVRALINAGANPNIQDPDGLVPLHLASAKGHGGTVRVLCDFGSNVHVKNNCGSTALHFGAQFIDVIKPLICYGADPELRNNFGATPYDMSLDNKENEVLKSRDSVRKQIIMPALVPALKSYNKKSNNIICSLFDRQSIGFRITGGRLSWESEQLKAFLPTE